MRLNWREHKGPRLSDEKVAWLLYNSAQRGATNRNLAFDITYSDVLKLVRTGKCAVSGIPFDRRQKPTIQPDLPFRASLDRIDNTKGYIKDNIQVVCRIYNHAKWNWNSDDVITLAKALVEKHDASGQGSK